MTTASSSGRFASSVARYSGSGRRAGSASASSCASGEPVAKSFLEPGVVADGGEVVVLACLPPERGEQLDRPLEMGERLVAGLARERREACVVEMEGRVVRHVFEAAANRFERLGVALLAVRGHRLRGE